MGMSASQARLLSITSRLSDNELRSQTITTAKMSLSNRTTEASAAYMDALSQTKLLYTTYDASGNKILESLTGASLSQYGELKNQYGLINNNNQILVSELDATNYENSADMYEFLDKYGVLSEPGKGDFVQVVNPDWEVAWDEYKKEYEEWKTKEPNKKNEKYWSEDDKTDSELYEKCIDAFSQCGCWSGESSTVGFYHVEHLLAKMLDYDTDFVAYPGTDKEATFHKIPGGAGSAGNQGGSIDQGNSWTQASEDIMVEVREAIKNLEKDPELWQDCVNLYYETVKAMGRLDAINGTDNGQPTMSTDEINLTFFDADESDGWDSLVERLKQALKEKVFNEDLYNKDYEDWLAQEPEKPDVPYYIEEEQRKIVNKDKGQWYVNLWHRMNGPSQDKAGTTDASGNVVEGGTTEGGLPRYKVLEDGLMNNADWLQYALEKGTVTLERVDFTDPTEEGTGLSDCTWTSIIWTNAQDITEEQNEAAITKAEVEYEQALRDIEAKDKQYDNQLKLLDSEHNALQTEYDSVKGVIEKNIERTLKIYS